ncbi:MAG: M3 family metallopeptidase [Burkholderiales bacterium]
MSLSAHAERITLPVFDEASLNAACDNALAKAKQIAAQIETIPLAQVTTANTLNAWNDLQIALEDAIGPIDLQSNVHPDEKVRTAGEACLLKATTYSTDLYQNAKLYQRVKKMNAETPAQKQLRKDLLEGFEDSGVSLPAKKRARVKQIFDKIEALRQEFDRNVRDNKTKLTFTAEELQGVPAAFLEKQKRDDKGNYLFGFDYPERDAVLNNADNEAVRKRYLIAFTNRGGDKNLALMDEVMRLRRELAGMYGLKSYAEYATRRRMVENPQTVLKFLREVKSALREVEAKEIGELAQTKAQITGKPISETKVNRWDMEYLQEKRRKAKFDVDQEALRKYFPAQATVDWALQVSSKLYGVKFVRGDVGAWHPDVQYFDVLDAESGKYLSGIYLDLYPREGKYKHAAAWGVRSPSKIIGRTPVSVLVTNFNRDGMDHREVETLFHEFGHVLHGVLSTTEYQAHGGTNTKVDFVEAPSQMFEEWARKPESIALLKEVCAACPAMDTSLIKRVDDARKFGQGIRYSRQHLYADFDMALVAPKPGKALPTWIAKEKQTPLGHVEGTQFPGSFSHLMSGYGSGYYGYMWGEVLALDMLSAFGGNIMNAQVGRRFRDTILANGGEQAPKQLVEKFLGRPANSKAFFEEITGMR